MKTIFLERIFQKYYQKLKTIESNSSFFKKDYFDALELEALLFPKVIRKNLLSGKFPTPTLRPHTKIVKDNNSEILSILHHKCSHCHQTDYEPKFLSPQAPALITIARHRDRIISAIQNGSMPPEDSGYELDRKEREKILSILKSMK